MSVSTNKWFSKQKIYMGMLRCYHYCNQCLIFQPALKKFKNLFIYVFLKVLDKIQDNAYQDFCHLPKGVNVIGFVDSEKGIGEAMRLTQNILTHTNWPCAIDRIIDTRSKNAEKVKSVTEGNPYKINLIGTSIDAIYATYQQKGEHYFNGRYTIFNAAWETEDLPVEWLEGLKNANEVWASSVFTKKCVEKVSYLPVCCMPPAVSIKFNLPKFDREYFQLPKNAFIFFFMFDFDSELQRKNPHGLVKAFGKAFTGQDDVFLLIKSSRGALNPKKHKIFSRIADKKNIIYIDKVMAREEIESLIQITDCYVSLHRSEGFGLTMAEAMSYGKPVIATAYSGNLDFMSQDNSYLVNYRLIELKKDYGPYKKGNHWAEPDLGQAINHMRFVYENRDHAQKTGEKAREYMTNHFSPEAIAKKYQQRLDNIEKLLTNKNLFLKLFKIDMKKSKISYLFFDKRRQNE